MKGIVIGLLALALLMSLNTPVAFSKNNSFTVEYKFNPEKINGQWMIEDTLVQAIPGEPYMLYYPARILLPQDSDVKGVKVKHSTPIIEKGFDIPWGQPPCILSGDPRKVDKNEAVYGSNEWYPKEFYEVVSVESFRGFKILNIILYPVQYKPKSQTVKFFPKLYVTVQTEKSSKNDLRRGLKRDKEAVRAMVDNPEVLATYTEEGELSIAASLLLPSVPHEYIIITNHELASAFWELANYKNNFLGSPVEIVEVEWIYAEYEGEDEQERIRNFIRDAYETWGTVYCLLGGDVSVIPHRVFFVKAEEEVDEGLASDMYYGCLDGDFDANDNSIYGEPEDDVDWLAEVYIGRAPVETEEEVNMYINKVITYELAEKPMSCQFHQARLYSENEPDSRQIAWDCQQWVPEGYDIRELFEEDGYVKREQWIDAWDNNPLLFQHTGDGTTTGYFINREIDGEEIWTIDDISNLTNDFFPVHMSVASFSGEFEADDCLAEAYINSEHGALACFMNSSRGWYSTEDASMYSGDFLETMFRILFENPGENEQLGQILSETKSSWMHAAEEYPVYRWCYYEINLLGDPETPILTQRVIPPLHSVTIIYPPDGSEVYGTVNITTSTTGCIQYVEFYIDTDTDPEATDYEAPFSYTWDTTTSSEDEVHTILVKGYCGEEFKDSDTVSVMVNNCHIVITNPIGGEEVFETVIITTDARGADEVEFYIDGVYQDTVGGPPFEYVWDTCPYTNGLHTIAARALSSGDLCGFYVISCEVANDYIRITSPQEGEVVSGEVAVTTQTMCIDEVRFYIDGVYQDTVGGPPFEYIWDTCSSTNGSHTIAVYGYYDGQLKGFDTVTVIANNDNFIIITNPQEGEEVSGTVPIITETNCVNKVVFYIDGVYKFTDTSGPNGIFEWPWDTTSYAEDEEHTILVEGYYDDQLRCEDTVTVTVNNYDIKITNPQQGEEVSCAVTITVDARGIDIVQFYIDEYCLGTDCEAPFELEWNTIGYQDGSYTIKVKGFTNDQIPNCSGQLGSYLGQPEISSIVPKDTDEISVTVNNCYVKITNPQEGEVSCAVLISVDTGCSGCVDTVVFYIDGVYEYSDISGPNGIFEWLWDTTGFAEDEEHIILVEGYYNGQYVEDDTITVVVNNCYVKITNPQEGEEVSGVVLISVDTGCVTCVDTAVFYIDGVYEYSDTSGPNGIFEWLWDTTGFAEDEEHIILVEGYYNGQYVEDDTITVVVNNCYMKITNPEQGEEVSGTITITTDTRGIDKVEFYIDAVLVHTAYGSGPFSWDWDTTMYEDGVHEIETRGYKLEVLMDQDTVHCYVNNSGPCLGSLLVFLTILLGYARIIIKKH